MKIENQVCKIEQSKILMGLGICSESCLEFCEKAGKPIFVRLHSEVDTMDFKITYPAWSAAELCAMLPDRILHVFETPLTASNYVIRSLPCELAMWKCENNAIGYGVDYRHMNNSYRVPIESCFADTEAEARATLLIYLLENKLVTAEYCNIRLKSA